MTLMSALRPIAAQQVSSPTVHLCPTAARDLQEQLSRA